MSDIKNPTLNDIKAPYEFVNREITGDDEFTRPSITYWQDAWYRFRQDKMAMAGAAVLLLLLIAAIIGPMIIPYSYEDSDWSQISQWPSKEHLFGTDALGRDLLVRCLYGARISLIIGFAVPMAKVERGAVKAMGLKDNSVPANLVSALISDLIYTPVITLAMIALVRKMAMKMSHGHAELPPFMVMFVKSLIISLIVAYIIILIVTPIYKKIAFKSAGVDPAASGGAPAGGPPADRK